jgi:hypothetical protein
MKLLWAVEGGAGISGCKITHLFGRILSSYEYSLKY